MFVQAMHAPARNPMAANLQSKKTLIAFYLAGMLFLNAVVYWSARSQVVDGHPDYSIFYTAGLMLRRGQGRDLYDNARQLGVQREFAPVAKKKTRPLPFNHPAFEGVLFVPLTRLSYLASYELWVGLNVLLLLGIVLFLHKKVSEIQSIPAWLSFLAALAFFPISYALMQGQDSIMLLALYCLAYVALRRGRDLQAGIWLGLGLFKFHLVLPFVLILFLRRRWRAVLGVGISGAFDLLLSWALVGGRQLLVYPRYAWQVNRQPDMQIIAPRNMANLRGLITGWSWVGTAVPWFEIALLFASLVLVIWAARQWELAQTSGVAAWNNGFAIAMIATFLVGYHGYNHDMSILFLPVMLLSARALQTSIAGWFGPALKLGLGLMMFSPVFLVLTLHFQQQHLFALVLLGLAFTLAKWNSALERGSGTALPA